MKKPFGRVAAAVHKSRMFLPVPATVALAALALAGCRGAPCSNCGACAPGFGYNYTQPYGTTLAPGTVQPGYVPPATIQPGVQYAPGTVPVAPQQMQPGSIYGG